MPRPGPRPYECVRRAWHSERHKPMRGSLIKEIFRIAHEIHSLPTKQNKDWQEKLPIVVLKAEEIMYSKANSEAEYMDPKTLLERVNDAIDTIIRRDEDAETGELLQPCIEAALQLGCIPRRASRSQRNINPRFYLGPYSLDKGDTAFKTTSPIATQHLNFYNSTILNSKIPGEDLPKCDFHVLNSDMNILPVPPTPFQSISYPAYPLYYGTYLPSEPQPNFMPFPVNMPKLSLQNASPPCDKDSCTTITEEDLPEELMCDLNLRLAPFSVSTPSKNSEDNVGLHVSSPEKQRRLSLCPDLCLSSDVMESQVGCTRFGLQTRNRRVAEIAEDQQFNGKPKLSIFAQEFQPPIKHDKFRFL